MNKELLKLSLENPKREKTKAFIHRIRSMYYHISSQNYDLYALNAEIEIFCEKHMLPGKVSEYILLVAEEALIFQKDFNDLDLSLSFSEKDGSVELLCESTGILFNPLEEGALDDPIGLNIIKNRCKKVDYSYINDRNVLFMAIRI